MTKIKLLLNKILSYCGYLIIKKNKPKDSDNLSPCEFDEWEIITKLPGHIGANAFRLFKVLSEILDKKDGTALEIGVFCGRSLLALSYAFPESKIVGIDPFYENLSNSPSDDKQEGDRLKNKSGQQTREQRIDNFNKISSINNRNKKIELKFLTQKQFLDGKIMEKFLLVHIDGEHTFKAVVDFLDEAEKVLKENALIIVDDFFNAGYPGISEAVYTHKNYKKTIFPIFYGFNKAVFIYKPSTRENVEILINKLISKYNNKKEYSKKINSNDGSITIQEK